MTQTQLADVFLGKLQTGAHVMHTVHRSDGSGIIIEWMDESSSVQR